MSTSLVCGHKYPFSISLQSLIPPRMDKTQSTKQHINSIIECKVPGIAHRRLMAFYQGSLEGCIPTPPTAQLPFTQSRFSSRAHFPKCSCFKREMSDISETNNPRARSLIFTASHLKDCGPAWTERILSAGLLIDRADTDAL